MPDSEKGAVAHDERAYFDEQRAALKQAWSVLKVISNGVAGREVSDLLAWAAWTYSRIGLTAQSIEWLVEAYVDHRRHSGFDHSSVMTLCRTIVEQAVFVAYLADTTISEDEKRLRKWTLDLHDLSSRMRLFKGLGDDAQRAEAKRIQPELQKRIQTNPAFQALPEDVREDILKGNRIYVRGARGAAVAAGWKPELWDGINAHLSSYVHGSPLSFRRFGDVGGRNLEISPYQLATAGFAIELAHSSLSDATEAFLKAFPALRPPLTA